MIVGTKVNDGGESGIRTLLTPLDSVSYRFYNAAIATNAGIAVAPCTLLHARPRFNNRRGDPRASGAFHRDRRRDQQNDSPGRIRRDHPTNGHPAACAPYWCWKVNAGRLRRSIGGRSFIRCSWHTRNDIAGHQADTGRPRCLEFVSIAVSIQHRDTGDAICMRRVHIVRTITDHQAAASLQTMAFEHSRNHIRFAPSRSTRITTVDRIEIPSQLEVIQYIHSKGLRLGGRDEQSVSPGLEDS